MSEDAEVGSNVAPNADLPLSAPTTIGATTVETFLAADGTMVEEGGT